MKMIEAVRMPQMTHTKILAQPQAESACRRHHKPMSAPPAITKWSSLTPAGALLLINHDSNQEIYAYDLKLP